MVIFGPGCDEPAVNRQGVQFGREESIAFYQAELPHGVCPACGGYRRKVVIRWSHGSSYYARKPGL